MNKLDLNAYGVSEMNAVEMRETDGGILMGFKIARMAYRVGSWVWNNCDIYVRGFIGLPTPSIGVCISCRVN